MKQTSQSLYIAPSKFVQSFFTEFMRLPPILLRGRGIEDAPFYLNGMKNL
jgi:hypothetical protein